MYCSPGVAAGDPAKQDQLHIGDVVVGETVIPYEHEKLRQMSGDEIEKRRRQPAWTSKGRLFSAITKLANELVSKGSGRRSIHVGAIATGSKLVESEATWTDLRRLHDKLLALEMEAEGVVFACEQHPTRPFWAVIKGIMDYGTVDSRRENNKEESQAKAARTAAEFVRDLLEGGYLPISDAIRLARR